MLSVTANGIDGKDQGGSDTTRASGSKVGFVPCNLSAYCNLHAVTFVLPLFPRTHHSLQHNTNHKRNASIQSKLGNVCREFISHN